MLSLLRCYDRFYDPPELSFELSDRDLEVPSYLVCGIRLLHLLMHHMSALVTFFLAADMDEVEMKAHCGCVWQAGGWTSATPDRNASSTNATS